VVVFSGLNQSLVNQSWISNVQVVGLLTRLTISRALDGLLVVVSDCDWLDGLQ
jgi:hypothetical protein